MWLSGDEDVVTDQRPEPMQSAYEVLVPHDAPAENTTRLLNRIQAAGWEVSKAHASEYQAVYTIYPKPDRDGAANHLPPAERGHTEAD